MWGACRSMLNGFVTLQRSPRSTFLTTARSPAIRF